MLKSPIVLPREEKSFYVSTKTRTTKSMALSLLQPNNGFKSGYKSQISKQLARSPSFETSLLPYPKELGSPSLSIRVNLKPEKSLSLTKLTQKSHLIRIISENDEVTQQKYLSPNNIKQKLSKSSKTLVNSDYQDFGNIYKKNLDLKISKAQFFKKNSSSVISRKLESIISPLPLIVSNPDKKVQSSIIVNNKFFKPGKLSISTNKSLAFSSQKRLTETDASPFIIKPLSKIAKTQQDTLKEDEQMSSGLQSDKISQIFGNSTVSNSQNLEYQNDFVKLESFKQHSQDQQTFDLIQNKQTQSNNLIQIKEQRQDQFQKKYASIAEVMDRTHLPEIQQKNTPSNEAEKVGQAKFEELKSKSLLAVHSRISMLQVSNNQELMDLNKKKPRFSDPLQLKDSDGNTQQMKNLQPFQKSENEKFNQFIKYAMDQIIEERNSRDVVRPKQKSIQSIQKSFSSSTNQISEDHSVWDNQDLQYRGIFVHEMDPSNPKYKNQTENFLRLFKIRFGSFPGQNEKISNEEVIKFAISFARMNKKLFKKYFPTSTVIFEDENDYASDHDLMRDPNFQNFLSYIELFKKQQQDTKTKDEEMEVDGPTQKPFSGTSRHKDEEIQQIRGRESTVF